MKLFKTKEAARVLGISYRTFLEMRREGKGPKWIKLTEHGSYRYTMESLNEYIEDRKRDDDRVAS